MIKLIGWAMSLGLMFGIGFWVGRITDVLPEIDKQSDTVEIREKLLKNVQKQLNLTYYSELIKKPEITPVSETVPEFESVPAAKPTPDKDKIAQALAKVLGSETPALVNSVVKQTLPVGTGSAFAIQVASLPNRKTAEDLVERLLQKGHSARLVQAELPSKGKMYRVRIHGFKTRQEADTYRQQHAIEGITVAQ